jgi:hypothetical protein
MPRPGKPWRPRRMLGAFRTGQDRPPDPGQELERLVLYLTSAELEEAQRQAIRTGQKTPQRYCEQLVRRELESARVAFDVAEAERRHGKLEGLRAIADDPDYLAEWTASRPTNNKPPPQVRALTMVEPSAESIVLRHAGLVSAGEAPALLPELRRGVWIGLEAAAEVLEALRSLEDSLRGKPTIHRPLCYALHKLAFEGQILASESWIAAVLDADAMLLLQTIQEGVDRVLSDEDIRYAREG